MIFLQRRQCDDSDRVTFSDDSDRVTFSDDQVVTTPLVTFSFGRNDFLCETSMFVAFCLLSIVF